MGLRIDIPYLYIIQDSQYHDHRDSQSGSDNIEATEQGLLLQHHKRLLQVFSYHTDTY